MTYGDLNYSANEINADLAKVHDKEAVVEEAPSDGKTYCRKDGNWAAIEGGGGSVDITDITNRLMQLIVTSGTCTDEDYNTLKEYADNGIVTYIKANGGSMIVEVKNFGGNIQLTYTDESVSGIEVVAINVSLSKQVTITQKNILQDTNIGSGLLGAYTKPASYSAISKEDSISTAIGKLEAGLYTKLVSGSSGAVTKELSPNTYYKFGECTSLTITLGAEVSGILNEYMFEFVSGATATVLGLPETVKWNNGNAPTIEANKTYIVAIVNNIAVIGGA